MSGIDRRTGKPIGNFEHAVQSVEVILSTRIGSRVMRRSFGGGVAELLGRKMTVGLFALFKQLVATAIDTWEPRFRVRRVIATGSAEEIRVGTAGLEFEMDYRPRAHLGDFRVDRRVQFFYGIQSGLISI